MVELPIITSLWRGGKLSFLEQVCLKSFADFGHRTILYTYEPVENCPPGVEQMDANRIFSISGFAADTKTVRPMIREDVFRYSLLSVQNVIWVDANMLCLRPWNFTDQWVFGWEKAGRTIGNSVLGLPRFSRSLQRLNKFCEEEYPIPPWGSKAEKGRLEAAAAAGNPVHVSELIGDVWNMSALTYFLEQTGEIEHAQPVAAFHGISFEDQRKLIEPGDKIDREIEAACYGLPLLRDGMLLSAGDVPHPESFLGRALKRHKIDAEAAPIPKQSVTPVAKTDRTSKERVYELSDKTETTVEPGAFYTLLPISERSSKSGSPTTGKRVSLDIPNGAAMPMERAPIDPDLPTVAGLWIGGTLSFLEQVCLLSFRDFGHRTILYSYHGVDRVPDGVEVRDASEVMPAENYITHKNSDSPALHSDVFRYHMIQQTGFVWIDADVLCVRPWRMPTEYLFGWEKPPKLICGAVLGIPQNSPGLSALLKFCEDEYPIPPWVGDEERAELEAAHAAGTPVHVTDLKWGVWGPSALTHFLYESGEVQETLSQPAFYPVSFKDRLQLLAPNVDLSDKVGPECLGVHLWNRRIRRRLVTNETGLPHPDSLIGKALLRHRVDPRFAPIPDTPPPGSPAQTEVLAKVPVQKLEALGALYRSRAEAYDKIENCANKNVAGEIAYPKGSLVDLLGLESGVTSAGPVTSAKPAAVAPAMSPVSSLPIDLLQQSAPYQDAIDNLEMRTSDLADRLPPLEAPVSNERILVLTSMKNEAPFILEWIAYHKAIGVTHFLVYTNDCRDNTNEILDRLADLGIVTRVPNPWDPASGKKPQHVALDDAMKQPVFETADWVLTIDVDEFVNIHVGDGNFADLFKAAGDPNVISFTWKLFGNDGIDAYEDRPIIEQFTACAPEFIPKPRLGWGFKSMVHKSAPYTKIGVHRPLKVDDEANVSKVRWVNGSGRTMPEMLLTNNGWRSTKRSLGYRLATLNHYVLRSAESFLVKRDRGRINHTEQDQGIEYWARRNYASETDMRMLHRVPMMQTELDVLMADPKLAALHEEAVNWHKDKITELKANPDYAALYENLTEIVRPDAIYLTKPEETDEVSEDAENGVRIPEPEDLLLTREQAAAKARLLGEMLAGDIRLADLKAREKDLGVTAALNVSTGQEPPEAPSVSQAAPARETVSQKSPKAVKAFKAWLPVAPDSALAETIEPRFAPARNHVLRHAGFFWEGSENAMFFEPFSKKLVVTFDNLALVKGDIPRWPWGYKFLTGAMDCSVLGVMATQRNWFRQPFVHDSFDTLRDSGFFEQFDEIIFYGASMGGFAALSYAQCAPGAKVFAVAPQTTLDRRILPDDNRWGWTSRLDWDDRYADASEGTRSASDVVVLYDPYFAPDVTQVERLKGDNIRKLRMPFFGHQLPNALHSMEMLKPILTDTLNGAVSEKRFYELLRARRDLPRYQHDLLMKAEEKNHLKLAIQVCEYTLKKRDARNIRKTLERLRAEVAG